MMNDKEKLARRVAGCAIALALAAVACSLAATAHTRQKDNGALDGTVLTADRAPVPNAVVAIWRDGKSLDTVSVLPTGQFSYSIPEGTYEIQAAAPKFRPVIPVRITVVVHAKTETWVNITMAPAP
jgi:Carboxypeptidase regulatory-like domain